MSLGYNSIQSKAMRHKRVFPKVPFFLCLLLVGVVFLENRAFRSVFVPSSEKSGTPYSANVLQDGVPAIDHPKFESVFVADQYLNNNGFGIAVQVNGDSRFYPYQILVWHQVVNDEIGGQPLLISYNPLAQSGTVYLRTDRGFVLHFGLSDKMVNSNLLLYDRETHSLWNPMTHSAVEGPKQGIVLSHYPSWVMTWNTYKTTHENGKVLSRETGFARDYTHNPYGNYEFDSSILFPINLNDPRLQQKELVYGIEWNQKQKAYPFSLLKKQGTLHDSIDNTTVSIEYDAKTELVRAYQIDASGNHQNEIPLTEAYWFSWSNAFPKTELYK